ncbi:MAG: hypothetical protein JOZ68_15870, partial [Acidimicrobiia bacterium]|nr:hypothetical protein [Acidimicrobiia bacterium]
MKKLAVLGAALLVGIGLTLAVGPSAFGTTVQVHCPASPPNDLQTALNNATSGETIDISGTCYGHFSVPSGITNLTLVGGATLDGQNSGRVLTIPSGDSVTVRNLTIQHGSAADGGGIQNNGTLTLIASTVTNNTSSTSAGGVANEGGTLTVHASTISSNHAQDGGLGGGIINDNGGTTTVNDSTISRNTATFGGGGLG